jgi:hypothetical protein
VGLLNTCANVVALEVGRWAHYQIIQCGLDLGALVGSSLVMWEFGRMLGHSSTRWNLKMWSLGTP